MFQEFNTSFSTRRSGQGWGAVGAHRLRHTVATVTINAGASLEEVGQLLRHRGLASTTIYAKVDLVRLGSIARTLAGHGPDPERGGSHHERRWDSLSMTTFGYAGPWGFKLEKNGRLLVQFHQHLQEKNITAITVEVMVDWAFLPGGEPAMACRPGLGYCVASRGGRTCSIPTIEVPPAGLMPARRERLVGFVYSAEEIKALMRAASEDPHAAGRGHLSHPDRVAGSHGPAGGRSHPGESQGP